MTVTETIKTIDKKIKQNKSQYKLVRQTAKVSVLSSGSIDKAFSSNNIVLIKIVEM